MATYEKIKQLLFSRINVGKTLRESFDLVAGFIGGGNAGDAERRRTRQAVNSLVYHLLVKDGRISSERREICRKLWEERFDHSYAETSIQELLTMTPDSPDAAAQVLDLLPTEQKQQVAEFFIALACAIGNAPEDIEFVLQCSKKFNADIEQLEVVHNKLQQENQKRKLLVSSGWGVLVAIGVILLFVITAKLLQSVIFGLIIGCILLPLEKRIEKQLRNKHGIFHLLCSAVVWLVAPLHKLSAIVTRRYSDCQADAAVKAERSIIRRAVTMTVLVIVLIVFVFGISVVKVSGHYMRDLRNSLKHSTVLAGEKDNCISKVNTALEKWRIRFEKLPPIKNALDFAGKVINEPETRMQIGGELLKRSGGMMEITADFFGLVTAFVGNLLLTIFFSLLFLFKLAEFCQKDDSDRSKSEYFVRTVFNGIWLPGADETIIREARRIIEGVFFRLRVWLKGYLTLVIVDSTVYCTIFYFMDLPFFWVLGIIAGCGILLPYIGPIISCAITVLITLAFGGVSATTVLCIIIAYLIYNGIIEQFILYPAVIGEALGLSTLETIVVVLLGAILAGIPGMIFALPAASVAKYIIPQLYRNVLRPASRKINGDIV